VELQSQVEKFKKRGLGVAALSYDSVAVLKDFATRKKITYPLLSDPDSKVIREFGLMNEVDYPAGHMAHGVPFPGTFVTDAEGLILTREFEKPYQERQSAASLLVAMGENGDATSKEIARDQFVLRTSVSNSEVAPGRRVTLILDFQMSPKMHAYAPGVKGYKPLNFRLADNPFVTAHEVRYPDPRSYTFAPLKETVPVFEGHFRILQEVTALGPNRGPGGTPSSAIQMTEIDLSGMLDYQVCSDTICYAPSSVPVQWTLTVVPLDRDRAPEALRKKP
jgi:peroxiredoxin